MPNISFVLITIALFLAYIILLVLPLFHGAPYVPTKIVNIDRLNKMLNIPVGTYIADLGSGDGRILVYFAQKGFKCDGYEINNILYARSKNKIKAMGLDDKISIYRENFLKTDLSKYGFIFMFQISYIMPKIEAQLLKQLKKGSIVASYCYKFKYLTPIKEGYGWHIYSV